MKYTCKGIVKSIGKTIEVGTNGFKKRELVLDISTPDAKYKTYALFEFVKDNCKNLDGLSVGTDVAVDFYLDAREWNGRWFASNKAVGIHMFDKVDSIPDVAVVDETDGPTFSEEQPLPF